MKEKFLYTRFNNFIWFLQPKTGSRSMFDFFKKNKLNFPVEINQEIPNDHSNCFKFAFVRNPWDRLVSTWKDKVQKQWDEQYEYPQFRIQFYKQFKGGSFKEFVIWIGLNGADHEDHIRQQTSLIPYDLVDFIGRFENLQEDFDIVCDKIGIPQQQLSHKNKTNHKHYTEYYDGETR